jgi:hypothetical protein
VFDSLLPESLRFKRDEPADLAAHLAAFAERDARDRQQVGKHLREIVAREHSVDTWAEGILELAR